MAENPVWEKSMVLPTDSKMIFDSHKKNLKEPLNIKVDAIATPWKKVLQKWKQIALKFDKNQQLKI